jgi:hypothetical protein
MAGLCCPCGPWPSFDPRAGWYLAPAGARLRPRPAGRVPPPASRRRRPGHGGTGREYATPTDSDAWLARFAGAAWLTKM